MAEPLRTRIVASPSNFGVTGERPSHPELLEYLAARLIENKWSLKSLHREIMLSAAYQLSTETTEPNQSTDPDNKLLWRANLKRLDAESLRDSLLFVSGTLDERVGGPPQELNGSNNKKRTVYARISRGGPGGVLGLFDFPDPSVGDQRSVTNLTLQGLFLLNNDLMLRQAQQFAERVSAGTSNDRERITKAYRLLYGRQATEVEIQRGLRFLGAANPDTLCSDRAPRVTVAIRDGALPFCPRSIRVPLSPIPSAIHRSKSRTLPTHGLASLSSAGNWTC